MTLSRFVCCIGGNIYHDRVVARPLWEGRFQCQRRRLSIPVHKRRTQRVDRRAINVRSAFEQHRSIDFKISVVAVFTVQRTTRWITIARKCRHANGSLKILPQIQPNQIANNRVLATGAVETSASRGSLTILRQNARFDLADAQAASDCEGNLMVAKLPCGSC